MLSFTIVFRKHVLKVSTCVFIDIDVDVELVLGKLVFISWNAESFCTFQNEHVDRIVINDFVTRQRLLSQNSDLNSLRKIDFRLLNEHVDNY